MKKNQLAFYALLLLLCPIANGQIIRDEPAKCILVVPKYVKSDACKIVLNDTITISIAPGEYVTLLSAKEGVIALHSPYMETAPVYTYVRMTPGITRYIKVYPTRNGFAYGSHVEKLVRRSDQIAVATEGKDWIIIPLNYGLQLPEPIKNDSVKGGNLSLKPNLN